MFLFRAPAGFLREGTFQLFASRESLTVAAVPIARCRHSVPQPFLNELTNVGSVCASRGPEATKVHALLVSRADTHAINSVAATGKPSA